MSGEQEEVLRGTTMEVYRFLLKSNKPMGAREVQRALNLSSPSLATYHLSKLEETGLLKKESDGFVVNKIILNDSIRIRRFLIPRFLFYSVFAITALVFELTLFRPSTLTGQYVFFVAVTLACAIIFCYETAKTWTKGGL
ncbi:MAG: winged helix-turn-helix domain-containing protein [Candidatus Bathyarchaeia archaeon]